MSISEYNRSVINFGYRHENQKQQSDQIYSLDSQEDQNRFLMNNGNNYRQQHQQTRQQVDSYQRRYQVNSSSQSRVHQNLPNNPQYIQGNNYTYNNIYNVPKNRNLHPNQNFQRIIYQQRPLQQAYIINRSQVLPIQYPAIQTYQSIYPVHIQCPHCQFNVQTITKFEIGIAAVLGCIAILFLFWPLFFLPLIYNGCKDVHHTCSNCNMDLGVYRRCFQ